MAEQLLSKKLGGSLVAVGSWSNRGNRKKINDYTDGSKLDGNRSGAGVIINYSHNDIA